MNKKGFTLIELIAVIVIISLLALLTTTAVTKLVKDAKSDLYDTQLASIKAAAETWGSDNMDLLPDEDECKYITLGDLKEYGLLDSSVINSKDNTELSDELKIKITSTYTSYNKLKTSYEVDSDDIEECTYVYPAVCTAMDTYSNYSIGDEYLCDIGNSTTYTFYILSKTSSRIDFIMSTNLENSKTAWMSEDDYVIYGGDSSVYNNIGDTKLGPVTALDTLEYLTKNWNVTNISYNYEDEGSNYGKIKTSTGNLKILDTNNKEVTTYQNMKARLPKLSEISSLCSSSCPTWLTNNTSTEGYWLLTSNSENASYAKVIYNSTITNIVTSNTTSIGIRPVISLPLSRISK